MHTSFNLVICHITQGDITPSNVLVDALAKIVKLADMGRARLLILPVPSSELLGAYGTPGYKDSVYHRTGEYTAASDV